MAANRFFSFNTVPECGAFCEGVEYVNDSAIAIQGIFEVPAYKGRRVDGTCLWIHVIDMDKAESESEKYPPHWARRKQVEEG